MSGISSIVPRSSIETPNKVPARGASNGPVLLSADPIALRRMQDDRLNTKIAEYIGLVHGAGKDGYGLRVSTALFQGVKRPRISTGKDKEVHVYVYSPELSFCYPVGNKFSEDKGLEESLKPIESVFVTYVEFHEVKSADGCDGVINFWEWVLADPSGLLPMDHETRYERRVW